MLWKMICSLVNTFCQLGQFGLVHMLKTWNAQSLDHPMMLIAQKMLKDYEMKYSQIN